MAILLSTFGRKLTEKVTFVLRCRLQCEFFHLLLSLPKCWKIVLIILISGSQLNFEFGTDDSEGKREMRTKNTKRKQRKGNKKIEREGRSKGSA